MDEFVRQRQLEIQENILKSVSGSQVSGNKGFPVGTVRYWNGKRYKKKINGDWVYSPEKKDKESGNNKELSDEERVILEEYSNKKFKDINQTLRGTRDNDAGTEMDINNLKGALNKLPDYKGDTFRVMGIEGNMEEIVKEYQNVMEENDILEFDAFLSTTKDREVVDNIYDELIGENDTQVIFNIKTSQNSKARDISEYAVIPSEEEILFKPNSQFEVINVDKDEIMNRVEVDLKEI